MRAVISLLGCLLFCINISAQDDSITQPPNIVLILADDVALMDFGAYGGEAVKEVEKTFKRDMKRKTMPWIAGLVIGIVFLIWRRRRRKQQA